VDSAFTKSCEEIAEPLGDADFHIGLPASEDDRLADIIPFAPPGKTEPLPSFWRANLGPPTYFNPLKGER
jgi:hypothetical protein